VNRQEKIVVDDIALFGGEPQFQTALHVGTPNVGDRDRFLKRAAGILDSRWFTNNGPVVQEFEAALCEYLGVKNCLAINNGTVALQLAARALGLTGEVIVPSFTFVATVHSMMWQGLTPVFCDVEPDSHLIDVRKIEALITDKTSAILGVHTWGSACNTDAIADIAEQHNLSVLYDAAHAIGSSHNGVKIGNFGDLECFSFHATKFVNAFEGGAITTNNDKLASKVRLLRNFGFTGKDEVVQIGTNGKMSEICAAMGLTSLESVDHFVRVNVERHKKYMDVLHGFPGIHIPTYGEGVGHNHQYLVVQVDEHQTRLSRDTLVALLHAEGVLARRYFYPGVHRMEPYRSLFPGTDQHLPETIKLSTSLMILPTGGAVTSREVETIGELIRFFISNQKEINLRTTE
jgi:dTDP-4-amino-4,6-dideoxygalactose transaminase